MKDLLQLAGVLQEADLRRFKIDQPLSRSRVLNIHKREMITVHLQGAVKNSGPLVVPKGSKVSDLKSRVLLDDSADDAFLNKKRRLKDEDVIVVPQARQ